MSKRPTFPFPSLSPSHTTKGEQHHFKECMVPIPGVLREANGETNTTLKPTWFFSARAGIFSECRDAVLMKKKRLKKIQKGEI